MVQIRSKKSIALALLALAVLTTIASRFLQNVLADEPAGAGKVYAYLRISQAESLFPQTGKNPVQSDKDLEVMKRNRLTIIKSRANLHEVLRKDNIRGLKIIMQQSNPTLWLEKALELDYPNDGDILRIGMSGSDPEAMAIIVNAVVDTYIQKEERNQHHQNARRLDKINMELVKNEERVKKQRNNLRDLGQVLKTSDVTPSTALLQKQILAQEIQDCIRELRRLGLEKIAAQEKISGKQLDEKLAILTQQEKYLEEQQKKIRDQIDQKTIGSLELDMQQQYLQQAEKTLILLRETKDRLELEGASPIHDIWVLRAEVFNSK